MSDIVKRVHNEECLVKTLWLIITDDLGKETLGTASDMDG